MIEKHVKIPLRHVPS